MDPNSIPVEHFDVAVVGGGTSGAFAAASAADAGAKTVLIEKNGVLGGTMTVCGVNYPGLFFAWGKQIVGGKCWELIKRVDELGGAAIPQMEYAPEKHFTQQIRMNAFILACALDEMEEKYGVSVRFHSMLFNAREDENGVELLIAQKGGPVRIRAKTAVDCTGDADLARMLGYGTQISPSLQPATLFVKGRRLDPLPDLDGLTKAAAEATARGELPAWIAPHSYSKLVRGLNMTYHVECTSDAAGSAGKSELERRARRDALAAVEFIKKYPGCESFEIESFSTECGVRETVRIDAETNVTAEDYITGRVFDDAICCAFYPIDLHRPPYDIKQVFFAEGVHATVPYGALIPKGSRRIWAAGRCVGSDTDANSALRVQAPCMAEGQAAGCAAALCAASGIPAKDLDINLLKNELRRQGAVLPGEEI